MDMTAAQCFQLAFLQQLRAAGYNAGHCTQLAWRAYQAEDLPMLGAGRDTDLARLQLTEAEVHSAWAQPLALPPVDAEFCRNSKLALILMPGYTHETLRKHSWHEQVDRRDSPHHMVMLQADGSETVVSQGAGLKLLYAHYPRSNAASRYILDPLFNMLQASVSLRRWAAAGYRFLFVGYSHGAPISLELLADLNSGRWNDDFLLASTAGFLGLSGDIGGAYLADDICSDEPQFVSLEKLLAFARRHRWFAKLAGVGTPQLLADIEEGAESLGHATRQLRLADYGPRLPAQLKYFTVGAVMPLADYCRRWWQLNLDDWSMYKQALVSDPISVYNDGQVVLADNLLPAQPQIPAVHNIHLGAVRTHHWGVSYKTFNFGYNRFPRTAFYRALLQTLHAEGLMAAG